MILAPLRGVTVRAFRRAFADAIREAGFSEAFTPFVPAAEGCDPLKDRELRDTAGEPVALTPQFIGKSPSALARCLEKIKDAGFETADLNCGCPFPMVRKKGRGSGLLRTPDLLRRMLDAGCSAMGDGKFSIKTRLGVERPDELLALLPLIDAYPLRFIAVHARTAVQMYGGECDSRALAEIEKASKTPIVENGDLDWRDRKGMVGRSFIRSLGERDDICELLGRYAEICAAELCGERPVVGRLKELLAYWKDLPRWRRVWPFAKRLNSLSELLLAVAPSRR